MKKAKFPPAPFRLRHSKTQKRKSGRVISKLSRHPLATVVVGFVLTVLLGAIVTYFSNYLQSEREHKLARITERQAAVQKMADAFAGWQVNAHLLKSAMAQEMPLSQLTDIKKRYDDATVVFNTFDFEKLLTYLKIMPFGLDNETSDKFADKYSLLFSDRIGPIQAQTDNCLSAMYTYVATGRKVPVEMWSLCPDQQRTVKDFPAMPPDIVNRLHVFQACSALYAQFLFMIGIIDTNDIFWRERERVSALEKVFAESFDQACIVRYVEGPQPLIKP